MAATVVTGLATLLPQLAALFLLQAGAFGQFSLVYLLFGLSSSVQLSVVAEAHSRDRHTGGVSDVQDYLGAAWWVAAGGGLVSAVAAAAVWHSILLTVLMSVSVTLAAFRVSARFAEIDASEWATVVRAECAGICAFALGLTTMVWFSALPAIALSWACAGIASAVCGTRPLLQSPAVVPRWCRSHRSAIIALLRESAILDASSIGGPYLVAPALGWAHFGVYRAVSNVAAPVRLLLNPLRPRLARSRRDRRLLATASVLAVGLGAAAASVLTGIEVLDLRIGVLRDLAPFAVATGLFVTASFLGHLYYIVARTQAAAGTLLRARLTQSGLALAMPVAGAWTSGLSGAIWGTVIATILGAIVWLIVAYLVKGHGLGRLND